MADIEIRAANCVAEIEAEQCVAGFAVSDDPEDGYVLFQKDGAPGAAEPLWLEVSDEIFAAPDAIEEITVGELLITLSIKPKLVAKFGMIRTIEIRPGKAAGDWAKAVLLLRRMLPAQG